MVDVHNKGRYHEKNAVLLDFVQIKIEGRPSTLEEMTIPKSDGLF